MKGPVGMLLIFGAIVLMVGLFSGKITFPLGTSQSVPTATGTPTSPPPGAGVPNPNPGKFVP